MAEKKGTPADITMEDKNIKKSQSVDFLTKDMILKADDLTFEKVWVKQWNGNVYVSTLTAMERDEFEKSIMTVKEDGSAEQNMANFRAKLCVLTIHNKNKKRMFDIDEAKVLGKKSAAAMDTIFAVAQRLNGIGKKDVEELTKN